MGVTPHSSVAAVALPSDAQAQQTVAPVADAYVSSSTPSTNTGRSTSLRVDGSPTVRSYLRFDLSGASGSITKATLRVLATSNQSTGYSVRTPATSASWAETGITYANAPPVGSSTVGSSGPLTSGAWSSVDVTSVATPGTQLDLILITSSSTAAALASRESASPPQLVVETAAAGGTPPANTAPPVVSGTPQQGATLTTSNGTWSGGPTSYGYQWRRCDQAGGACADIGSANAVSYVAQAADVGFTLRSVVTATNTAGSSSATSAPTGVVAAAPGGAPGNTALPTISGTAREERTLTASTGTWTGVAPITFAYQWHRCDAGGNACSNIPLALASSYALAAVDVGTTLRVAVTATNGSGSTTAASNPSALVASRPPPGGDPVIAAAGDIACAPESSSFNGGLGTATSCRQKATADLLVGRSLTTILPLGDVQYECASPAGYQQSFDPTWGRQKPYMRPTIGNHEYHTGTGCSAPGGYFGYFGSAAGDPTKGYYSYDLGAWHLIALNANCSRVGGCGAGSPQETWLRADLAANQETCTLAYWHQPHFSSGSHGNDDGGANPTGAFWDALYEAGADVVLNGHDHVYERFAPQTPLAVPDPQYGIREFVVGTGGKNRTSFQTIQPNSEVRNSDTYGVLTMTLRPTGYDWQFVPEAGKTFADAGSTPCHGAPAPPTDSGPPTGPTNLTATAISSSRVDLSWSASMDDTGVTGYRIMRNGTLLTTVTGTSHPDTTVAAGTSYQYVVHALDAAGNVSPASSPADVTTPPATPSGTIFSDGFESGDFSQWTASSGMTVQQALTRSGAWAARQTTTSAATHAYKQLATAYTDLYYSLAFNIVSQGANNVYLGKIRTGSGGSILGFYRSTSGTLNLRNDAGAVTHSSTTSVSLGQWHTLELHAVIAGASGQTEVWLDGQLVGALSRTQNLGTAAIARVQIGDNTGGRTYDVAIDDVRVGTSR
jgi:fibronectin type III domain protein/calcineurin-like phosphoesterase family protein